MREKKSEDLNPSDSKKPASPKQKAEEVDPKANASNPSASPAPVSNKPVGDPRASVKQEQPEKAPSPKKEASLKTALIMSCVYKAANCGMKHKAMKPKTKKAALKETIKNIGTEKVAALVLSLRR